jgi:hypothetical protein
MPRDTRLIERWLPISELGIESVRERTPMTPFPAPNRLHVWWARRHFGMPSTSANDRAGASNFSANSRKSPTKLSPRSDDPPSTTVCASLAAIDVSSQPTDSMRLRGWFSRPSKASVGRLLSSFPLGRMPLRRISPLGIARDRSHGAPRATSRHCRSIFA